MPLSPFSYHTTHGTLSFGAGECDVGLDAVTRRVDVQARIRAPGADPRDPSLLKAEATDRGDMAGAISYAGRRDAVAVRLPGPIGLLTKI